MHAWEILLLISAFFLQFFNLSFCVFFLPSCSYSFNALKWHNSQSVFRISLKVTIRASERATDQTGVSMAKTGSTCSPLSSFFYHFFVVFVVTSWMFYSLISTFRPFFFRCAFFPFSFSFSISFQGLLCVDSSCKTYILNDFTWNANEGK